MASYNVQNLFDLKYDSDEYRAYVPDNRYQWNEKNLEIKLDNLARVIRDLQADVLALQEVESEAALRLLRKKLRAFGVGYQYARMATERDSVVRCALLSDFPVADTTELNVPSEGARNILKTELNINGENLFVYNNHWPSREHEEEKRIAAAEVLRRDIDGLADDADILIVGDLNSNYDAWRSQPSSGAEGGRFAINQVLGTVRDDALITERTVQQGHGGEGRLLYNLWLELPEEERWSYKLFEHENSLDHIIVSAGLYDDKGVSYADNSFGRFVPAYLMDGPSVFRWQRARKGKGKHVGEGFSDHVPVYAEFSTRSFRRAKQRTKKWKVSELKEQGELTIEKLYRIRPGRIGMRLKGCVVIYKEGENAVIKQRPEGRGMFIYDAAEGLERGHVYDLTAEELKRYHGLLELTAISDVQAAGDVKTCSPYLLQYSGQNLFQKRYINEVVSNLSGSVVNGYLRYGPHLRIRLYAPDVEIPANTEHDIELRNVRIGCHEYPELFIPSTARINRK